ncbi:MAG: nicotinamide mononucleotide transporter [Oscillospiraceae bacterium]|nr:nicotinamide mononucleotide transporter [Oscillospiraceae bacterium]
MNQKTKAFLLDYLPILVLAPLIVAGGIIEKQAVYKIIPAVVSLFATLLMSKLYRAAFLLGAANCVLYSVGYFMEGLYGSLLSALVVSAPLQVVSFILWKRSAYKQATVFRVMKARWYPLLAAAVAALWGGMLWGSKRAGGANGMIALDALLFALGLAVTVLLMLAFVEGYALNILNCVLNSVMWAVLTARSPRSVTYLLIALYTVFRTALALASCLKMYRAQRGA